MPSTESPAHVETTDTAQLPNTLILTTAEPSGPCTPNPCLNSGLCYVNSTQQNTTFCGCLEGFRGALCNQSKLLSAAQTVDLSDPDTQATNVKTLVSNVTTQISIAPTDDKSVVVSSASTIATIADRLSEETITPDDAVAITQDLFLATTTVVATVGDVECNEQTRSTICQTEQKQALVNDVEDTIFSLASIAASETQEDKSVTLTSDQVNVTARRTTSEQLAGSTLQPDQDVSLTLPQSLTDIASDGHITLMVSVIEKDFYTNTPTFEEDLEPVGEVISVRLQNEKGEVVHLDENDPISLEIDVLKELPATDVLGNETNLDFVLPSDVRAACLLEFNLDTTTTTDIKGRFNSQPYSNKYDFHVRVSNGLLNNLKLPTFMDTYLGENLLKIKIYRASANGNKLYIHQATSARAVTQRRRLLQASSQNTTLVVSSVAANVWVSSCTCWQSDPNVQIDSISEENGVKFTSNFFGSFSISQVVVAPNLIDFGSIFAEFNDRLADSPYVLALNCVLIAIIIVFNPWLRRLDQLDAKKWAYLPLLGNKKEDQWLYAVSLQTSRKSSKRLDTWPCISLIGQYAHTGPRVLKDGKRESFKRGATDNFILSHNINLGNLMELKIWIDPSSDLQGDQYHDIHSSHATSRSRDGSAHSDRSQTSDDVIEAKRGSRQRSDTRDTGNDGSVQAGQEKHSRCSSGCCCFFCCRGSCRNNRRSAKSSLCLDWKLDHITIMDLSTGKRYIFLCNDWLSKTHGTAQTKHHLAVLDTKNSDSASLFDIISKRKLMDEHLWFSVATRPAHSRFTRQQRFMCAMSIFFLGMITNAMWYQTGNNSSEDATDENQVSEQAIEFGPLRLTYRTFYVGVVSSVIILIPAFLMTFIFRKRQTRQPNNTRVTPSPELVPPTSKAQPYTIPMTHFTVLDSNSGSRCSTRNEKDIFPVIDKPHGDGEFTRESSSASTSMIHRDSVQDNLPVPARAESVSIKSALSRSSSPQFTPTASPNPSTSLIRTEMLFIQRLDPQYNMHLGATSVPELDVPDASSYSPLSVGSKPLRVYSDVTQSYDVSLYNEFLQRAQYAGEEEKKEKKGCVLPWWTIFIGYTLCLASISASAFFTFMYSLEWGGEVSLEWMTSLFFSTTTGCFVLEPLKILLITLLLACLLRDSASDDLSEMAPLASKISSVPEDELAKDDDDLNEPTDGDPKQYTSEMHGRRTELQLKQRLFSLARGIFIQCFLVFLVACIVSHSSVTTSFYQNQVIRQHMNLTTKSENLSTTTDLYNWMTSSLIPSMLPKYWSNNKLMPLYDQRFASDHVLYRFTHITFTQVRVTPYCRVDPYILETLNVPLRCVFEYDDDYVEKRSFHSGWKTCAASCNDTEFIYAPGDERSLDTVGEVGVYEPGGYRAIFPQETNAALSMVQALKEAYWLDHLTRAVIGEFSLFNANTRLFSQAKTLFEMPTYGEILPKITVKSARLYPYTDVWDYMILLCQLLFALILLIRICALTHLLFCPKNRKRLTPATVVEVVEISISLAAVTLYSIRIVHTIDLVEFIRNQPGEFASLDTVIFLDESYNICMSCILFIRILHFLAPLAVNYYVYIMRVTLMSIRMRLLSLGATVIIFLVAFGTFFYLFEGPVTYRVRTVPSALTTLLTLLLGMGKYRDFSSSVSGQTQTIIHRVMYGLFGTMCTVILLNFAISILNLTLELIKTHERKAEKQVKKTATTGGSNLQGGNTEWNQGVRDQLDRQLGTFVWQKLASLLGMGRDNKLNPKLQPPTPTSPDAPSPRSHTNIHRSHREFEAKFPALIQKLGSWNSSYPPLRDDEDSFLFYYMAKLHAKTKESGSSGALDRWKRNVPSRDTSADNMTSSVHSLAHI